MKIVRLSKFGFLDLIQRLLQGAQQVLLGSLSYVQHLVMKVAIAFSLKLCIFTARVLLNSNVSASESF
ncbi:MAG: hypothetical protein AAF703_05125 [Cyanobacteria bacterium P01_D01_bin.105]